MTPASAGGNEPQDGHKSVSCKVVNLNHIKGVSIVIKYEIVKGSLELCHTHPSDWTVDELKNYYDEEDRLEKYESFIDSFETEDEARKCFETEKDRCVSFYNCNRKTLEFECLSIWKNEYDDEGDIIQGDVLDAYVSPIISNK